MYNSLQAKATENLEDRRSEFGKLNSVTVKKSTNADKYTNLDDGKTTPAAEATMTGATSEKALPMLVLQLITLSRTP
jgi:hypothetical protein